MDKFPEAVIVKIVQLTVCDNKNIKVMRLISKQIKDIVDKQITCISPVTISPRRLGAASRRFPKIDTLNLKQSIILDDLVHFDDDNTIELKKKKLEKKDIEKQEVIVVPLGQHLDFHNLKSLQLCYFFEYGQHRNVCKLISVLSNQISVLELEFVALMDYSEEHDIFSLFNGLQQLNNLRILTLNNESDCYYKEDVVSLVAQLVRLEELHIIGRIWEEVCYINNKLSIAQLTTLTNLRKIHIQYSYNIEQFKTVQNWVDFLQSFQFLQSILWHDYESAWELLEALVQFPNIQTVGVTIRFSKNDDIYSHQRYISTLTQISEIKSQLYLHVICESNFVLDYLQVVPSTCIQSLSLREKYCQEHLKTVDLLNLQRLQIQGETVNIFSFHKLHQLTDMKWIKFRDIRSLSSLPNLKILQLHNYGDPVMMVHLEDLSKLCAKGILQQLYIYDVDFNTALVDSICVTGQSLHYIYISDIKEISMQEFKNVVRHMFDKLEAVASRMPQVCITSWELNEEEVLQAVQKERRRRLFNMVQRESIFES